VPEGVVGAPSRRLLRTPAPQPDESWLGYLLRLTEQNGYDSLRWIPERAGLKVDPMQGRWADLWRPGPQLSLLCEMIALSEAELAALCEPLVPNCLVRWKAPKVCPACLREESWCRKAWEVLPFTACPQHGVVLIDQCPRCHCPLTWARKSVSVCRCGEDWRRLSLPVIEHDQELTAARWMLAAWQGAAEAHPLAEAGVTVYAAALCALLDAWLSLRQGLRLQPQTDNELCHRAVAAIAPSLDDWPEGFFRYCDQFDDATLQSWQQVWFSRRSGELSETEGWLWVAAALEEYLEERWAGQAHGLVPKRFLSREEVGRQLGLNVSGVDHLAEHSRLSCVVGVKQRNLSWIDVRSLRRWQREIENLLPAAAAADELGIGMGQLRDLVRYGWLAPERGPLTGGGGEMKFSPQTLAAFLGRISQLVTPVREGSDFRVVSLNQVADHLELHELSFGQFVEAMFAGFPRPVSEGEGPSERLSRFWLRVDELNQYLNTQFDLDRQPAVFHYTVPSLKDVVEWLDRKQDEGENRFYRSQQAPLDAGTLIRCLIEVLGRLSTEQAQAEEGA